MDPRDIKRQLFVVHVNHESSALSEPQTHP